MNKLIAALVAIMVTGAAGFTVAQETPKVARPQVKIVEVETTDEAVEIVLQDEGKFYVQRTPQPEIRFMGGQHGQPGTWQIVNVNNLALLLNTATGETYSLEKGDDGLHWKPVPRPKAEKLIMPRLTLPRLDKNAQPKHDQGNFEDQLEDLEKKINELKERFEKSDSVKEREKLERAIKDLKDKAENLRKERKKDR